MKSTILKLISINEIPLKILGLFMEIYPKMFTEALKEEHRIRNHLGVRRQRTSESVTEHAALPRDFCSTCDLHSGAVHMAASSHTTEVCTAVK